MTDARNIAVCRAVARASSGIGNQSKVIKLRCKSRRLPVTDHGLTVARMGAALSLIPELEDGSPARLAPQARSRRCSASPRCFSTARASFSDAHVDAVRRRIRASDRGNRDQSARRTRRIAWRRSHNAPVKVLRTLGARRRYRGRRAGAQTGAAAAGGRSLDLAQTKSQAHLQAISARQMLGEAVTDVLVRRGDREVARSVADNRGARISETGFFRLVKRAESDGVLAEKVGLRPDIPPPMFRELLTRATAVVHQRLLAAALAGIEGRNPSGLGKGVGGSRRPRRPARLSRGATRRARSAPVGGR